jgi:hypothetical protein
MRAIHQTQRHKLLQNFSRRYPTVKPGAALGLLCCFILYAGIAPAEGSGALNSAHDFSGLSQSRNSWNSPEQACSACHVSHDFGSDDYQSGLHWNSAASRATYTTYVSNNGIAASQPSGTSKLCLGCHDGTFGIDDFGGDGYSSGLPSAVQFVSGNSAGRNHPVGVEYYYNPADPDGLHSPSSPMGLFGTISDVLDNGKVVCSSCHDVHNNESLDGARMLRAPMRVSQGGASTLCLSCHKK